MNDNKKVQGIDSKIWELSDEIVLPINVFIYLPMTGLTTTHSVFQRFKPLWIWWIIIWILFRMSRTLHLI
mgnify:CR=1 FL=1